MIHVLGIAPHPRSHQVVSFTGHAVDRMLERAISPSQVFRAIDASFVPDPEEGVSVVEHRPTQLRRVRVPIDGAQLTVVTKRKRNAWLVLTAYWNESTETDDDVLAADVL